MSKKAFLVGVNKYKVEQYNLGGCVNDAKSLKGILEKQYGFNSNDISLITDSDATRESILGGLRNLLDGASAGDTLVFGFSGHGIQKPNNVLANEADGKNEAIVPYEISWNSLITDDELNAEILKKVNSPEISFTAIYDCCHSGTMFRDIQFNQDGSLVVSVINRVVDKIGRASCRERGWSRGG